MTGTAFSLGRLANEYLDYSRIKHSEKTYKEKRDVFRRFFLAVPSDTQYKNLSGDVVRLYLQKQSGQRSGFAANKDRKNLLAWANWCFRYKGCPARAIGQTEKFPEVRQGRYIPPEEDFWKVYEGAQGQDKTMLLAYLHLAARKRELFRLRWDDVDWGGRKIRLYTRKRKDGAMEADFLPMTDQLFDVLMVHRDFVAGEWVFPNARGGQYKSRQHWLKRVCKRAGVRPFDWHSIRHLTATILAQMDVPMVTISRILRHRSLAVTERYIGRLDSMKEALEKAFLKLTNVT
jgi:integrase